MADPWDRLLPRLKANDKVAVELLYVGLCPRLVKFVERLVNLWCFGGGAEDVVNEVFCREMGREIPFENCIRNVTNYMTWAVGNECRNLLRKKRGRKPPANKPGRKRRASEVPFPTVASDSGDIWPMDFTGADASPQQVVEARERFAKELGKLQDSKQRLAVGRLLDGQTIDEIATEVGLDPPEVFVLIGQGLKKLSCEMLPEPVHVPSKKRRRK